MCSVITHPAVPIALYATLPKDSISSTVLLLGAVCSAAPDLDVIGFRFGIRYGDMLGHRGLTHSILFAAALAALLTFAIPTHAKSSRLLIFIFLFISTLSHGVLDALTNGGLGVAFFAPFHNGRYFFPWQPIEVSPIGVGSFFSARGMQVLLNELKWVWLPSGLVFALGLIFKRYT
ncbi:MAG TPA: metal-dependent hydrolase [Blastocatellia bacterium]|nr:metal-dependent hydrolase [Blastocatellia bacterium]